MISAGAVFAIVILGLRFLLPSKVNRESIRLSDSEFKKTYLLVYFTWIAFGIILSYLVYKLNMWSGIGGPDEYNYNLYPDMMTWIGFSTIVGFALGIILCLGLVKLLLVEKADEFWTLYDIKYKFRAFITLKILITILSISGIALTYLASKSYFKITDNGIAVSRLFELAEHNYNYKDIKEIKHEMGYSALLRAVHKPHYEIIFNDGYRWNTIMDFREPRKEDKAVFEELSELADKEIRTPFLK